MINADTQPPIIASMVNPPDRMRLDKWLWAARFFKTRSLATDAADQGRINVNGLPAKPARDLRPGDMIELRLAGGLACTLVVKSLSIQRGPAPVARALYEETADSVAQRLKAAEDRRLAPEPALSLDQGRPTKRNRRDLERSHGQWQRWSASIDDKNR